MNSYKKHIEIQSFRALAAINYSPVRIEHGLDQQHDEQHMAEYAQVQPVRAPPVERPFAGLVINLFLTNDDRPPPVKEISFPN